MTNIRVRFAPSPTGHLHIGGARSALFNWLFARHHGGQFIIRIEDTDQSRHVQNAEAKLLESLKWLGIDWDESVDVGGPYAPYRSMDRLDIYRQYVERLVAENKAYPCYCTEEELERDRETARKEGQIPKYTGRCRGLTDEQREAFRQAGRVPSIRFKVPAGERIVIKDEVRGTVAFEADDIGDFVIVRPNGVPTYNFAVTIDDAMMKITHVIRGEEHLSNTPRQVLIYRALGFSTPAFAHVSLILNADRQKMSKRDESIIQFVEQYRDLGYLPEALINFLVLLGWSPGGEEEIFKPDELIRRFSLERVSKSPAVFDVEKLRWMNNHYIKMLDADSLTALALPFLQRAGLLPEHLNPQEEEWARTLILLYQEQLQFGQQIVELSRLFFQEEVVWDEEVPEVLKEVQAPAVLASFIEKLAALNDTAYDINAIKQALKQVQKETGYKGKELFMPIRAAATGQTHGRDLPITLWLLGKEKVVGRLRQAIDKAVSDDTK